ncbi:MAG: hypothetical protein WDA20_14715 [Desulfuromonadales bacterium]
MGWLTFEKPGGCRLLFGLSLLLWLAAPTTAADLSLTATDCRKCHAQQVQAMRDDGAGHQAFLTCLRCHRGHPPRDLETIRPCGDCHQGSRHVERQGSCLICHRDPHRPLRLTLVREAAAACLDCHPHIGEQFTAAPSMHARFACTACHKRHGEAFPCGECHLPHFADGAAQPCQNCHPPHRPLAVAFAGAVDSRNCTSCHVEAANALTQGGGRHREVPCAECHAGAHGAIPECLMCHPQPHPSGILARFTSCGECHGEAHRLIR